MDLNAEQLDNNFSNHAMDVCCQKIVEHFGDKPIHEWRSVDYNKLSSQLGNKTKVYLSENTLKRIFGKLKTPQRYFPQKATRDALVQFIGYADWEAFENVLATNRKQLVDQGATETPETVVSSIVRAKRKWSVFKVVTPIFVLIALALIMFFVKNGGALRNVKLVCENPYGDVPHTAVFKLQSKTSIDEKKTFEIDFMDEATRAIITGKNKLTKFFRNPGVVYATLLYDGRPIDTTVVYLQTKGWVANSGNDTANAYPIASLQPLDPKNIYVSEEQLDSAGLNTTKSFLVGFSNIKPTHINGDNFTFSCKVSAEKNRPGNQCVGTTIIILGSEHRHLLKLYRQSCVAFSHYKFSEEEVLGSDEYLGALAFDPENGGNIDLTIKNKHVSLSLNGKHVLSTAYKHSIGKVVGVKILFNGIGRVISPNIQDLDTKETL